MSDREVIKVTITKLPSRWVDRYRVQVDMGLHRMTDFAMTPKRADVKANRFVRQFLHMRDPHVVTEWEVP